MIPNDVGDVVDKTWVSDLDASDVISSHAKNGFSPRLPSLASAARRKVGRRLRRSFVNGKTEKIDPNTADLGRYWGVGPLSMETDAWSPNAARSPLDLATLHKITPLRGNTGTLDLNFSVGGQRYQLPLWVNLRHSQPCPECPKPGDKRTSISGGWMSVCSHKQTHAGQQWQPQFGRSRFRWWEPPTASKAD